VSIGYGPRINLVASNPLKPEQHDFRNDFAEIPQLLWLRDQGIVAVYYGRDGSIKGGLNGEGITSINGTG
jgi:hypothetical protein